MENFNIFGLLQKIDVAQRIVYGVFAAEEPDGANEIMDYESSKPEFEKWSAAQSAATDGKSLGNVRAMHGKVAVGKVISFQSDDLKKRFYGAVKVVDDAEWAKVEAGVYTGFSVGGSYKDRKPDTLNKNLKRYTAVPKEMSLVDNPCIKSATFEVIKADGSTELRKFTTLDEPEVKQVWQAADGSLHETKKAALAKAAPAKHPALEALDKMNGTLDALEKREFTDEQRKADASKGAAMKDGSFPIENEGDLKNAVKAFGRAKNKMKAKMHIKKRAKALGMTDKLPETWKFDAATDLKKGMMEVSRLACILDDLSWLRQSIEIEQEIEHDESSVQPDMIEHAIDTLAETLKEMVAEEVMEMQDCSTEKFDGLPAADVTRLLKFNLPNGLAKVRVETNPELEKFTNDVKVITEERDGLKKVIDGMSEGLEKVNARLAFLERQPRPPKGIVRAVDKGQELNATQPEKDLKVQMPVTPSGMSPRDARALRQLQQIK